MSPSIPVLVAVAVVEHASKVLVGRRPAGKPLAGLWEFPGGKVLPGETPEEAAAVFNRRFERSADASGNRERGARALYEQMNNQPLAKAA